MLSNYMGSIKSHCKDPSESNSISTMGRHKGFWTLLTWKWRLKLWHDLAKPILSGHREGILWKGQDNGTLSPCTHIFTVKVVFDTRRFLCVLMLSIFMTSLETFRWCLCGTRPRERIKSMQWRCSERSWWHEIVNCNWPLIADTFLPCRLQILHPNPFYSAFRRMS